MYVINDKRNDTLNGLEVQLFDGVPYLTETLGDKTYKIQAQSFFQTNSEQAEILYNVTKDFAGLTGSELVYDLYTGTGSIALYVADKASKVVGIEYVEEAIIDAKENAQMNGVENCIFFAGDMKDILTEDFISEYGKPDVVITDPPRDGMHPSVVARLLEAEPHKIVYVSCNPATQARDSKLLSEKYELTKIQPVDMFPHTHHVENVALYTLKS
jgi:23S rRNA (uracil1939-C5)-methyltransferase